MLEALIEHTSEQNIAAEGSCTQIVVGKVQKQAGTEEKRGQDNVRSNHLGGKAQAGDSDAC